MKLDMQLPNTIPKRGFSRNPENVPTGRPFPPSQKIQIINLCDFDVIWNNIFICLPIIVKIDIYE